VRRISATSNGRSARRTRSARLLPEIGRGTLAFTLAPEDSVTLDRRAIRPLPPGRMQGNDSYTPDVDALVTGDLALTWTHRHRLTQTSPVIVDHISALIGPEPGVSPRLARWVRCGDLLLSVADRAIVPSARGSDLYPKPE
jgi:hypothetical protein